MTLLTRKSVSTRPTRLTASHDADSDGLLDRWDSTWAPAQAIWMQKVTEPRTVSRPQAPSIRWNRFESGVPVGDAESRSPVAVDEPGEAGRAPRLWSQSCLDMGSRCGSSDSGRRVGAGLEQDSQQDASSLGYERPGDGVLWLSLAAFPSLGPKSSVNRLVRVRSCDRLSLCHRPSHIDGTRCDRCGCPPPNTPQKCPP